RITQVDTPYRAYEHPGNAFVSQFIGKTNLLNGTVLGHEGGQIRVDLGSRLQETGAAAQADAAAMRAGDAVTLCIRPEKLSLGAPGTGRLAGRVTSRFFLGSQWLYRLDSDAGEMLACCQNEGGEPLAEGATVGIDWRSEAVRVIRQEAARG
ncbi:MAG: TOBE domain-containing protein, partial [Burkholderia sp.]